MATQAWQTAVSGTQATGDATPLAATGPCNLRKSWAYLFQCRAVAQNVISGNIATISCDFAVRVNASGVATIVGSGPLTVLGDAAMMACSIAADITSVANTFTLDVVGIAATNIDWAVFTTVYAHKVVQ